MDTGSSGHGVSSSGHSTIDHALAFGHGLTGHTALATVMLASHDLSFCVGHSIALETLAFAYFAHATNSNNSQFLGQVSLSDNPDFGHPDSHSDGITAVQSGVKDNSRSLYLHVVNHGFSGLYHELESFAQYLNINCIDRKHTDIFPQSEFYDNLIGLNFSQYHFTANGLPSIIYPKASGKTHIWRRYFQIKPANGFHVHHEARTFIEVIGVTWFYREKRSFETKVFFNVISLPVWDANLKQWGFSEKYYNIHAKLMQKLVNLTLGYLKSVKPN